MTSKWLSDLSDVKTLKVCEKIISVDGGEKKKSLEKDTIGLFISAGPPFSLEQGHLVT